METCLLLARLANSVSALGFSVQELPQLAPGHPLYRLVVVDGCACFGQGEEEGLNGIVIENQTRASGK